MHIISTYFLAAASNKRMGLLTSLYGNVTHFLVTTAKSPTPIAYIRMVSGGTRTTTGPSP